MTYPFASLPANLIAFCTYLRREHRFHVGPAEVHDAARALEILGVADERAVRDALRPVLVRSRDDVKVFDEAFSAFFFPGPQGVSQPELPGAHREIDGSADQRQRAEGGGDTPEDREFSDDGGTAERVMPPSAADELESGAPVSLARASYSPLDAAASSEITEIARLEPAWRDAARLLLRRLQLGLARRWRPSAKGRRFDLRRTMRASLHTGGEALVVRWLRRPKRAPRFVVLVDGSRSMAESATIALRLTVAIASVTMRVEAYSFSTQLERLTDRVRRAAVGEPLRLEHLPNAWGGGTTIGACLREFLRRFGDRVLGRETLVIIASDGLDVGETDALREAMRDIRRRSAGVVWLNPLLETAGYEPTARGMLAARPYITTFASVGDAAGLARLARTLRVRV